MRILAVSASIASFVLAAAGAVPLPAGGPRASARNAALVPGSPYGKCK
jgi:hypothetical protein